MGFILFSAVGPAGSVPYKHGAYFIYSQIIKVGGKSLEKEKSTKTSVRVNKPHRIRQTALYIIHHIRTDNRADDERRGGGNNLDESESYHAGRIYSNPDDFNYSGGRHGGGRAAADEFLEKRQNG